MANLDSDSVTPVDLGTWRAGAPIAVGSEPVAIAVSVPPAGGATAFVADHGSNTVTPIDVATMTAGAAIPVGPGPQTIAAAPGEVLVGNFGNRTLTSIDPDVAPGGRHHCAAAQPDRHRRGPVGCHRLRLRRGVRGRR